MPAILNCMHPLLSASCPASAISCSLQALASTNAKECLRADAGDKLFFDSRDGSSLDLLTVAETAPDPIAEEPANINGVQQLSVEATKLNHHFSQQASP